MSFNFSKLFFTTGESGKGKTFSTEEFMNNVREERMKQRLAQTIKRFKAQIERTEKMMGNCPPSPHKAYNPSDLAEMYIIDNALSKKSYVAKLDPIEHGIAGKIYYDTVNAQYKVVTEDGDVTVIKDDFWSDQTVPTKTLNPKAKAPSKKNESKNMSNSITISNDIPDNVLDENNMMSVVNFGSSIKNRSAKVIDRLVERQNNTDISTVSDVLKSIFDKSKDLQIRNIPEKDSFFARIFTFIPNRQELIANFRGSYKTINSDVEKLTKNAARLQDSITINTHDMMQLIADNKQCLEDITNLRATLEAKLNEMKAKPDANQHGMFIDKLEKKLIDFDTLSISIMQTNKQIEMIVSNNYDVIDKINNINTMMLPLWRRQFAMVNTLIEQNSLTTITKDHITTFEMNQAELNKLMIGMMKG